MHPGGGTPPAGPLPAPDTVRWVARRKAHVIAAIAHGLLTVEEASRRYRLSLEELASWQGRLERDGVAGLKVSRIRNRRAGSQQ